jgi:glycosyltransferase involved in cell wall biosynthesis
MGDNRFKICMLADSHGLYDDRIYWKEAVSLKKAGYDVHIVLAGKVNEKGVTTEGISYEMVQRDKLPSHPFFNYLAKRLPGGLYSTMFKKAADAGASVYHIHDLKMNKIGGDLRKLTWKPALIYDVHDPYPENILDYWPGKGLKALLKRPWSCYIRWWEKRKTRRYDLIITTEENLQQRFKGYFPGKKVEIIYNYTDLSPVAPSDRNIPKAYDAIYTGGITGFRGAWKILEAVRLVKETRPEIKVLFLGSWFPPELKGEMQVFIADHGLTEQVILKDAVSYHEVAGYYRKSRIGLGIFLPIETHRIILQIKLFEYMNFGLPILGSNFGHIERIIHEHGCGLTVDPEDPQAIAAGLLNLLTEPGNYNRMSENAVNAVSSYYRWGRMEKKLVDIYHVLIPDR